MKLLVSRREDFYCDIIVRTSKAAKLVIQSAIDSDLESEFDCVYFDCDLESEQKGYYTLKWALEYSTLPDHIQIVTTDPVSKQDMAVLLKSHNYETTDNNNFYKIKTADLKVGDRVNIENSQVFYRCEDFAIEHGLRHWKVGVMPNEKIEATIKGVITHKVNSVLIGGSEYTRSELVYVVLTDSGHESVVNSCEKEEDSEQTN